MKLSAKWKSQAQVGPRPANMWENTELHTSVISSDKYNNVSDESNQIHISKDTEWTVDFEIRNVDGG